MKTTGIIRRVDDLGRIVVPKEIRKNIKIKNGDNLEILVEGESIILRKYSEMESIENTIEEYVDTFYQVTKHNIIVTDKERVISISGPLKNKYKKVEISNYLQGAILRRDNVSQSRKSDIEIMNDVRENCYYSFSSIVHNGDAIGLVIILSTEIPLTDSEHKLSLILSKLLSKHFVD